MYINRSILLLILVGFVFTPTLIDWIQAGSWYRPYFVWVGIVVAAFLLQRSSEHDEL